MIRLILFLACIAMASMVWAGYVVTNNVPNGGFVATKYGTGYVVLASTRTGTVTPAGTTGQCMGILCGVTYSN